MNQLKNALLAQAFLKERKIDYVLATQHLPRLKEKHIYLEAYFNRLDTSAVLWHQYFIAKADRAAVGGHAGPRSHAAFAIALLRFFGRMKLKQDNKGIGRSIVKYASHLTTTDEDWNYCREWISKQTKGLHNEL
jgi:hypothetical protein